MVEGRCPKRSDCICTTCNVGQNLGCRNSYYREARSFQESCSDAVCVCAHANIVDKAIDFDRQTVRQATEVDYVWPDWMLAPEFHSARGVGATAAKA